MFAVVEISTLKAPYIRINVLRVGCIVLATIKHTHNNIIIIHVELPRTAALAEFGLPHSTPPNYNMYTKDDVFGHWRINGIWPRRKIEPNMSSCVHMPADIFPEQGTYSNGVCACTPFHDPLKKKGLGGEKNPYNPSIYTYSHGHPAGAKPHPDPRSLPCIICKTYTVHFINFNYCIYTITTRILHY